MHTRFIAAITDRDRAYNKVNWPIACFVHNFRQDCEVGKIVGRFLENEVDGRCYSIIWYLYNTLYNEFEFIAEIFGHDMGRQ